jgi:hypothetical protein
MRNFLYVCTVTLEYYVAEDISASAFHVPHPGACADDLQRTPQVSGGTWQNSLPTFIPPEVPISTYLLYPSDVPAVPVSVVSARCPCMTLLPKPRPDIVPRGVP